MSQCQLHLWTISFPCQALQPSREFCPSPYIIPKPFQCAKFFRKKWKYKTFSFVSLNHSGLCLFFVKASCQLRTFTEGVTVSFPLLLPFLSPLIIILSSDGFSFGYHWKIHCVNLDFDAVQPRQHLPVNSALIWPVVHSSLVSGAFKHHSMKQTFECWDNCEVGWLLPLHLEPWSLTHSGFSKWAPWQLNYPQWNIYILTFSFTVPMGKGVTFCDREDFLPSFLFMNLQLLYVKQSKYLGRLFHRHRSSDPWDKRV